MCGCGYFADQLRATYCRAINPRSPMSLLTILDAELAFGLQPLLDRASLTVQEGERIGLIGRNGTGKCSLLARSRAGSSSTTARSSEGKGCRSCWSSRSQRCPPRPTLRESLALRGATRDACRRTTSASTGAPRRGLSSTCIGFGLDEASEPAARVRRRAQAGARLHSRSRFAPDLLLLDEPTNHLDIDGIALLEELLRKAGRMIVITHDRAFLDRVTTRIVELDRGLLRSYPGQLRRVRGAQGDELAAEAIAQRASSTSSGSRRKRGSATASRRGARATRAACDGSKQLRGERARAARTHRPREARCRRRRALGQARRRADRRDASGSASRADRRDSRPAHHARRPPRPDRPQRRRQDHAAAS